MTPEQLQRRCQRIYQLGCLCCRQRRWFTTCQVHHLNFDGKAGQKRRGDEYTVGLCPYHHVGEPIYGMSVEQCRDVLGPSLKLHSRAFRDEFGSDEELLEWQNELIEHAERAVIGHTNGLSAVAWPCPSCVGSRNG